MPSSYPAGLDTISVPGANLSGPPLHSTVHAEVKSAIEAIEAELGLDPAGAFATVRARLDAIGTVDPGVCQGRLTLTTALPVTTADVTGASTIYFTPYKGNKISLYSGTAWAEYTLTERSIALSGLTSARPYDVFAYDSGGVVTLELLAWTSDTARATALALQDGVLVKSGALTRRYLGTIYTTGTNTTEDSIAKRYVWNYYNRVPRQMFGQETTASWTYNSGTMRASNASALCRLNMVIGVSEDTVEATAVAVAGSTSYLSAVIAIGLDSTSTPVAGTQVFYVHGVVASSVYGSGVSEYRGYPGVGLHYLQQLESNDGGGQTVTFLGSSTIRNSNIKGTVLA